MIVELENRRLAENIFAGWEETMIWSCLQGIMGHVCADDKNTPASAMALLGDFCFFAGQPREELAAFKPEWCRQDFIILVPQSDQWAEIIENCYGDRARKVVRYAFKKEPDIFDRDKLSSIVMRLSSEYTIRLIDETLFHMCKKEEYRRKGLALVCGARLILECLDRGIYPSWDAQNTWSVSLAEKLGYHFDHEYDAYEISVRGKIK